MNVLSLFDGASCGRIALERAGIEVNNYYSSEIDKYAIQIANKNYPQDADKRLGDVTKWQDWNIDWSSIDLVTGGFPCQAWSVAGKQQGDKDERGMLFWTMLDIMKKVLEHNPKAKFLIENVKMKKEFEEYITFHTNQALGAVYKHLINSALVSAQNRQRYYWTNIEGIEQLEDKGILLRDILEDGLVDRDKSYCIDANYSKGGSLDQYFNKSRRQLVFLRPCDLREYKQDSICHHIVDATDIKGNECIKRVYADSGKAPTLTTMTGGHREPKVLIDKVYYRKLTPLECERLQTLPDNYTDGVSNSQRYKMIGNGWTVDVISHIFKGIKKRELLNSPLIKYHI